MPECVTAYYADCINKAPHLYNTFYTINIPLACVTVELREDAGQGLLQVRLGLEGDLGMRG